MFTSNAKNELFPPHNNPLQICFSLKKIKSLTEAIYENLHFLLDVRARCTSSTYDDGIWLNLLHGVVVSKYTDSEVLYGTKIMAGYIFLGQNLRT